MAGEALHIRPERVVIIDTVTGEELSAQFNPDEVKEKVAANFNELGVLGLSHKPLQYQNTSNLEITFDFAFDAIATGGDGVEGIMKARNFLLSLCYPVGDTANDIDGAGPPRVLFVWPELYSILCRVKSVDLHHKRFRLFMGSTLFTASMTLIEARAVRTTSREVRDLGTLRGNDGSKV